MDTSTVFLNQWDVDFLVGFLDTGFLVSYLPDPLFLDFSAITSYNILLINDCYYT